MNGIAPKQGGLLGGGSALKPIEVAGARPAAEACSMYTKPDLLSWRCGKATAPLDGESGPLFDSAAPRGLADSESVTAMVAPPATLPLPSRIVTCTGMSWPAMTGDGCVVKASCVGTPGVTDAAIGLVASASPWAWAVSVNVPPVAR